MGPKRMYKRMRRREREGVARFITFSCHRRLALLGTARLRDLFVAHVERVRVACRVRMLGWVVMPEHVHLLLVPDLRVAAGAVVLRELKREVGRAAITRWKALGARVLPRLVVGVGASGRGERHRFWQAGGGYDHDCGGQGDVEKHLAYIHTNPVRRGLVERPTDWAWSSARWYAAAGRAGRGWPLSVGPDPGEGMLVRERYRLAVVEERAEDGEFGVGWSDPGWDPG
jgi:putative transposase